MLLLEPKPFEPTKHQYDYDVAACHAFLEKYDLMGEVHVNIEVNHATLSGHDFAHEGRRGLRCWHLRKPSTRTLVMTGSDGESIAFRSRSSR